MLGESATAPLYTSERSRVIPDGMDPPEIRDWVGGA
jgi:hypothetical protein